MAVITGASVMGATPGLAQGTIPASQVRAINLARNTAVAENGGLTAYRPQPCMFQTSAGGGDCLVNHGGLICQLDLALNGSFRCKKPPGFGRHLWRQAPMFRWLVREGFAVANLALHLET